MAGENVGEKWDTSVLVIAFSHCGMSRRVIREQDRDPLKFMNNEIMILSSNREVARSLFRT